MRPVRTGAALLLTALSIAGCGARVKPLAGTIPPSRESAPRGRIDDPRQKHLKCLHQQGIQARKVGQTSIQIGAPGSGPRVIFEPTPGAAQSMQIYGEAPGAEVIGSALLYPDQAGGHLLTVVENCVAQGVNG